MTCEKSPSSAHEERARGPTVHASLRAVEAPELEPYLVKLLINSLMFGTPMPVTIS